MKTSINLYVFFIVCFPSISSTVLAIGEQYHSVGVTEDPVQPRFVCSLQKFRKKNPQGTKLLRNQEGEYAVVFGSEAFVRFGQDHTGLMEAPETAERGCRDAKQYQSVTVTGDPKQDVLIRSLQKFRRKTLTNFQSPVLYLRDILPHLSCSFVKNGIDVKSIVNEGALEVVTRENIVRSVASSSIGNILEWYEYVLYAYFSEVISVLFFPSDNHFVSIILTFSTFAVGLAARPFGGIIFGYIGDRYSRKKMLAVTILLMSIPTFLIGILPTYAQIGIFAPLSLIMLRIIQGVALGGEFGASCVYLFESVPQNKRGLFGSFALTGVGTGLVLSACTIFIVESWVSKETLYAYAWRIPFFISVVGSILAFYMRKNLLESQDFLLAQKEHHIVKNPLRELVSNHKATLIKLFSIFLTTQISFFVVFIFGKTMMRDFLGYDMQAAGKINILTMVSYTLATVVFGYLSDKTNKLYIILGGAIGIFASILPFIYCLENGLAVLVVVFSLFLGMCIGMTEGTLNSVVAESFPTNIRATSVAFCWNFTSVAFGGVAPILSIWFIQTTGTVNAVAYYLMGASVITIGSTLYTLFSCAPSQTVKSMS